MSGPVATKEIEDITLTVEVADYGGLIDSHYCGYAAFQERPLQQYGYEGIVSYVPVHGGVTHAGQDDEGRMVYGFDCGHGGDDSDPKCHSFEWILAEAERMALSIIALGTFEKQILAAMEEIWKENDGQV